MEVNTPCLAAWGWVFIAGRVVPASLVGCFELLRRACAGYTELSLGFLVLDAMISYAFTEGAFCELPLSDLA